MYCMDLNFRGTKLLQMSANLRTLPRREIVLKKSRPPKSTGFSSTLKLVPDNCVSYRLQPAEKPPLQSARNRESLVSGKLSSVCNVHLTSAVQSHSSAHRVSLG